MQPYTPDSKEEYVENLFASIAPRYDLLNSILSLNRHRSWRKFAIRKGRLSPGDSALDVAAGTLDLTFGLSEAVGTEGRVVGVDFCRPMLELGLQKMRKKDIRNVLVIQGNAEHLPVPSNSFQAATIGFALRNVASVENALAEMTRAVVPGGRVVSLELMRPEGPVLRRLYKAYSRCLPFIGGIIHGKREPYSYLPESINRFHSREELSSIMVKVGLTDIEVYDLTGGIATVHVGIKK